MSACATLRPAETPDFAGSMAAAHVYLAAGQDSAAAAAFEQAAALDPASKEPWLEIARIRQAQGRHVDALAAAEQVLRRDPTDADAHALTVTSGLEVARRTMLRLMAADVPPDEQQQAVGKSIAMLMAEVYGPEFLLSDELRTKIAREAIARYRAKRVERLPEARQDEPKGDPLDLLGGD
ncbi:hypothetical protein N799_00945 [Lysobacter arseniciresistens ZS79]|uniref:Uncharacterized protein n=1 Tax=Lysobacter arseniciresistens ZS79 TaxID=913325 RepID=A0A0A0F5X7_9GAMM|nr:hypothetical protein N799_00945 [Lysobacter arseniciresistens ZS79]